MCRAVSSRRERASAEWKSKNLQGTGRSAEPYVGLIV